MYTQEDDSKSDRSGQSVSEASSSHFPLQRSMTLPGQGSGGQNVPVDEAIDTDDYKAATQQAYEKITADSFARLKWLVLLHLTCAFTVSSTVAVKGVPILLGEDEKILPSAAAFGAMLIPSVAGAISFALTVTAETTVIAPHVIHKAILDAKAKVGTMQENFNPYVNTPFTFIEVGGNAADDIEYDVMLAKPHRPDILNILYNIAIIIVAGTFLFTNFDLADVGAELEGQQVSDTTAEKALLYGTEMVVHTVGGAIFPAVLSLLDKGVRSAIEACAGPTDLKPVNLPSFLALVNAVALGVAMLTTIALVESGLSNKIDNPMINVAITAILAGLVAPAMTLAVDGCFNNNPSESLNRGINAVGSGIARIATCQDLRALCAANSDFARERCASSLSSYAFS